MGNLFEKLQNYVATAKMEVVIIGVENSGKTTLLN